MTIQIHIYIYMFTVNEYIYIYVFTVQQVIRCKLGCVVSFYKAPTSYFTLLIIANGAHLLWFLFIVLLQKAQVRAIWSYDLDVENPVNKTYQTCRVSLQIPMKVNHLECIKSKQLDQLLHDLQWAGFFATSTPLVLTWISDSLYPKEGTQKSDGSFAMHLGIF